jgi:dipeptidyl-peptidase-4
MTAGCHRLLPLALLLCPCALRAADVPEELRTVAERTRYRATAHGKEVEAFLAAAARRGDHVRPLTVGKTSKGRPIVGAIVAKPTVTSPADLKGDGRLVVLIIGNIHSGECCGQEALLRMLRELCLDPDHPCLKDLVLLLVPNYNADGNEVRSKFNRPRQVGPAGGMGQRANAQGFDLNRDYVKLESPEARALVELMNRWNPHCFIDCHTTDGSWHRYQLTYDVQHNPAADPRLGEFLRRRMMPAVTRTLQGKGIDTFYYGNFNEDNSRWLTYGHEPRYGLDYAALRGRLAILSEAYAYITFRERIEATHAFVGECLNALAAEHKTIARLLAESRRRTVAAGEKPGDRVAIRSRMVAFPEKFVVKGYDPPRRPRLKPADIVPGVRPEPPGKPKDYRVTFLGKFEPTKEVRRPFAYLIPKRLKGVVDLLRKHGVRVEKLAEDKTLDVEVYRWEGLEKADRPFQKHRLARATVSSGKEKRAMPAGTFLVRTGQPLGNLIVYLLEPESDDGLVTWNFLDEEYREGGDYPILRVPAPVTVKGR